MSILTRAQAIQSKFPTNIRNIRSEQENLRSILKQRAPVLKEIKGKESAFQTLRGESEMAMKGFRTDYGTGADDSRSFLDIAEGYRKQKIDAFNTQDFAPAFASVKRLIDGGWSEDDVKGITLYGMAEKTWHDYQKGKQAYATLESDLGKTRSRLQALGSYETDLKTAKADLDKFYTETKSYQSEIDASVKKLRGFGSSQQEIDAMLGQPGQRKRGTRQSAQRRTMLTSRSAFA